MKPTFMTFILCTSVLLPTVSFGDDQTTEVVFLRSSMVGKFIKSTVYEVNGTETKFIGILGNKSRITHKTTPGKHTYMVVSEAADFMEAELSAGETYYSIVTPRMGAWKARFSMWPIKNDDTSEYQIGSDDFNKWMKKTKDYIPGEKDFAWYEKNKDSVEEKKNKYWTVWLEKPAKELAARTLSPTDGLPQ